jgi:hypothetical protein
MQDVTLIHIGDQSISQLNEHIFSAKSTFILLHDQRVSVSVHQVDELLKTMNQSERIAIVQPKILVSTTKLIHPFGGCGGFVDRLGKGYIRGAAFRESEPDSGQFDRLTDTPDWIFAPIMLIRRDIYVHVCGLDESLDGSFVWMDLGARIRRMGYELRCYSGMVFQVPATSISTTEEAKSELQATVRYVTRHGDGPWVLIVLMWMILELIYVPGNILQLRFKLAVNRTRSIFRTMRLLPELIRERYTMQEGMESARITDQITVRKPVFSIFWNHFARLGKTASNLLTIFLVIASVFSLTMRDRR